MERMDSTENSCLVCHEAIAIYAIGKCDHAICYKCSTRMRALCEQFYCPTCRTDLPEVFFLTSREKFPDIPARKFLINRKLKIHFENEDIRHKFEGLLEHKCRICKDRYPEKTFKGLQDHMRRVHTMFFCDLCLALKIFSSERKCYNRQDLASHRRIGDKDDKSYKGHPLCQFCDERYLDKDELYKHLRKDHYFCHFCESLGSQDFFQEYNNLKDHFVSDHFVCEEGDCIDKQFENAFKSEIDLKAHRATYHSKAQSRAQSRQERTINIDINLVPRPTNRGRGVVNRNDYAEVGSEGGRRQHTGGSEGGRRPHTGGRQNFSKREKQDVDRAIQASLSTMSEEALKQKDNKSKKRDSPVEPKKDEFVDDISNFPSLGDRSTNAATTTVTTSTESSSLANKFALSHNMSVGRGALGSVEDFPVLAKSASGSDLGNLQPSINYTTLKSSQSSMKSAAKHSKKSVPPKSKSPPNTFSNKKTFHDREDDFPELPKGRKSNQSFGKSASTWQNIVQPTTTDTAPVTSNVSLIRDKPGEQQETINRNINRPKYDESDFPSLGGPARSGPSLSTNWGKGGKNNTGPKNNVKSQESSRGNQNTNVNIMDRYSPVNIPDSPESDRKMKNSNKKKKKKETANPKEKIKKENNKNALNGNNSLDDIASLLMNKTNCKVPEKEPVVQKPATKPEEPIPFVSQKQPEKVLKGKDDKIEKMMEEFHINDEPEDELPVTKEAVKFVIDAEDFPSLGKPKKASKKPPPGFKKEKEETSAFKAPPGFVSQASKKPPPGFVSPTSEPETNSFPEATSLPSPLDNYEYHQPEGFVNRNRDLIREIQSYCEDSHAFTEFKRLSGEFRRSDISALLYYENCEEVLGKENFTRVFSELLALLPDIGKQQELLSVYIQKHGMKKDDGVLNISKKPRNGKGAWTPTLSGFLTCQTCHQVLVRKDYNTHVLIHNLDTDFPSLSGEAPDTNSSSFGSYGSWVKAK